MSERLPLWGRFPLRVRLTLWYVLLLALTVVLTAAVLHVQLERQLVASTDAALEVITAQLLDELEMDNDQLAFEIAEIQAMLSAHIEEEVVFAVRLLAPGGDTVWDGLGGYADVPRSNTLEPGFSSRAGADSDWRVLTQSIRQGDRIVGWLEVAQSLEAVEETLEVLRSLLLVMLPAILLLAGGGGFFLADRALRPIGRITATARAISAGDLAQRLQYRGPADEVGELARTFDAMLARLEAAWAQERRFTADAAHELRTPLAVLKGQIEVTRTRPRATDEYERVLDELDTQVDRLIRLSGDLLFLARFDQQRPARAWEPVDLSRLLASLAEQMAPLFEAQEIAFVTGIPPGLIVYGEDDLLIRLFLNLLQNAYIYAGPGARVRLAARLQTQQVEVRVADTGPGIPADALPHLFNRFYRVQDDRSRATGGAGLGLAIGREIAQAHGGSIHAESRQGAGATFIVVLPLHFHA